MFIKHFAYAHTDQVKTLVVDYATNMLYSASLDGYVLQYNAVYEATYIVKLGAVAAACFYNGVLIVCATDGTTLRIAPDSVDYCKLKLHGRPRSVLAHFGGLVASDVDGNLYFGEQEYKFGTFEYDGREVPNGVNGLSLRGDLLAAALSSGHVCIFDLQKGISGGPIITLGVHAFPARAVVMLSYNAFFSGGNDGHVYYTFLSGHEWHSLCISPRILETEYVFGLALDQERGLLAVCPTGPAAFVLDVSSLLAKAPEEIVYSYEAAACVEVLSTIPLYSDCWCAAFCGTGDLAFGCDHGEVLICSTYHIEAHDDFIAKWAPLSVPESKYAGGGSNVLNTKRLFEEFNYGDIETAAEIAPLYPLFLCVIEETVSLVCNCGGTYFVLARIYTYRAQKVVDPKGRVWDLAFDIEFDATPGKQLKLYMNIGEDAYTAGMRFLGESGLIAHYQTDYVDQIQYIREFLDKNAPRVVECAFLYPDQVDCIYYAMKTAMQANLKGGIADAAQLPASNVFEAIYGSYPIQMGHELVEKAYSHISEFFGDVAVSDVAACITGSSIYLLEFEKKLPQQLAAFLCICAFCVQTSMLERGHFDQDFISEVMRLFIESTENSVIAMSARLLAHILNRAALNRVSGKMDIFYMKCYEFLRCADYNALIARAAATFSAQERDKQDYQQLAQLFRQLKNEQ